MGAHRVCTDGSHGGRSPGRSWQLLLLSSGRTPQGRWPATFSSARRPRPSSSASAIGPAARRREAPPTHTVKHKDHGSWAAIIGCEARACCAGHGRMQRSKAACVRRAPGSILALLASSPATPPPATVCFSTSPPDCEQLLTSGLQCCTRVKRAGAGIELAPRAHAMDGRRCGKRSASANERPELNDSSRLLRRATLGQDLQEPSSCRFCSSSLQLR